MAAQIARDVHAAPVGETHIQDDGIGRRCGIGGLEIRDPPRFGDLESGIIQGFRDLGPEIRIIFHEQDRFHQPLLFAHALHNSAQARHAAKRKMRKLMLREHGVWL